MHDIGALIWVIVVVIGVISSIVQNARKAAATRSGGPARAAVAAQQSRTPAPARMVAVAPSFVAAQPPPVAPPVAPPAASFSAPEAPQMPGALRLPASFHLDYVERSRATGYIAGMFKDRKAFVRAIVAAEVLGKPKALQEQSIWSPRHSEPSI